MTLSLPFLLALLVWSLHPLPAAIAQAQAPAPTTAAPAAIAPTPAGPAAVTPASAAPAPAASSGPETAAPVPQTPGVQTAAALSGHEASHGLSVPLLELADDGHTWLLSVDFDVPLTPPMQEALVRGLPLQYIAEFELTRPRWWWWDAAIAERASPRRLSYHALTRQYRLAFEGQTHAFDTLDEGVRALAHVRGWRVFESAGLEPGYEYEARVRLRLDSASLPKPVLVSGMANRDWNPQSEWKYFRFTMPMPKSAP